MKVTTAALWIYLAAGLLVVACFAAAGAEESGRAAVAEVDALRMDKVAAERTALDERFKRLSMEAQLVVAEWQAKGRELDALLEAEAKKAGVDPRTHELDPKTRTWKTR